MKDSHMSLKLVSDRLREQTIKKTEVAFQSQDYATDFKPLPDDERKEFKVTITGADGIEQMQGIVDQQQYDYVDGPGLDIEPASFIKENNNTIAMQNDLGQLKVDHLLSNHNMSMIDTNEALKGTIEMNGVSAASRVP